MKCSLLNDKKFNSTLLKLAIPVALQHLVIFALGMVDTVMIGQLGKTEIAAVSIANQFHFLLLLLLFGVSSGISVFTAQYFGKKDIVNIRRMVGIGLITGIFCGFVYTLIAILNPDFVLKIYSKDLAVITKGSLYLKITALSYIASSITIIFSVVLRSIHQVKMPLIVSSFALITNSFLNYLLIFGNFGFPELGVKGAAIATVSSRILEMIMIVSILYIYKNPIAGTLREFTDFTTDMLKKCLKTSTPVVVNEFGWGMGVAAFTVVYARMSTDAVAAYNISDQAMNLSMVVIFGTCMACSIVTGNSIGAGKSKEAIYNGNKFIVIGALTGLASGIIIIILSPFIPLLFNVSEEIRINSRNILFVFGLIVTFKSLNFHMIVGILRGGGDTTFGMILDVCGMWLIGLPLAAVGAFYYNLPVYYVYLLASSEEIVKFFFAFYRFKSKKWITDLVN